MGNQSAVMECMEKSCVGCECTVRLSMSDVYAAAVKKAADTMAVAVAAKVIGGIGAMTGDVLRDVLTEYKTELWDLYAEFLKTVQNSLGDYNDQFITAEQWVTEKVVELRRKSYRSKDRAEDYFDLALVFTVLMDHAISFGYIEVSRRLEALTERAKALNEKMYRKERQA